MEIGYWVPDCITVVHLGFLPVEEGSLKLVGNTGALAKRHRSGPILQIYQDLHTCKQPRNTFGKAKVRVALGFIRLGSYSV